MIPDETIALIRERTDLVPLVQESVPSIKRRGRSWVGLCPFHKEKSPSFHVNQERGFYKCFGCGESGDCFTFVQREYGYSFLEAAKMLAERLGIEIVEERRERTQADRARQQKDDVYSANNVAATWFEEQLRVHPLREMALAELARRGIVPGQDARVDDVLQAFRIGYAPDGWDGLATFFRQQGISPQVAELAGLLAPRSSGSGHYDRFRHRLMFSVVDMQRRVVAFSGRALPDPPGAKPRDEKPAKYINSTETPVYTKGNVLFGLFQARQAIRERGFAIVVEGNFDVFSLHARDLANVVAPLGTAFTDEQAALLKRYTDRVVLLFDGDAAGRAAVRKARGPCAAAGLVAKVAALPDGVDPDDFVRTRGAAELETLVKGGKGLLEFLIDAELDKSFVAADVREKLARVDAVVELIAAEPDALVRMEIKRYADALAGRLDIHGEGALRALEQKLRGAVRRGPPVVDPRTTEKKGDPAPRPPAARQVSAPKTREAEHRRAIVGALLDYPTLLDDPAVGGAIGLLEGPAALTVAALRRWTGARHGNDLQQKALDTPGFLAQIPASVQPFAADRLASPVFGSESEAKEALLDSAKKLERALSEHEGAEIGRGLPMTLGSDTVNDLREVEERARRMSAAWSRTGKKDGGGGG